jgi:hypothetical protein
VRGFDGASVMLADLSGDVNVRRLSFSDLDQVEGTL